MNKNIYVLYVLYTHDINDIYEEDAIGYFESRELAEEAMKTMEPDMEKHRKELIETQQELFEEDPIDLEKLYSDEFVLSIGKFPLNVIEWPWKTLKSCPFCGSDEVEIDHIEDDDYPYYIVCYGCNMETEGFETKEQAVKAWNRRAPK